MPYSSSIPVLNQFQPSAKTGLLLQGQSVQGQPIPVYGFGHGAEKGLSVLVFAGIHGDEPESVVLVQALLKALKAFDDSCLKSVGVIECLNPDGLALQTRKNANGVDLNRNFDTQNWSLVDVQEHYYGGPSPLSEPESQFLKQVVLEYQPQLIISVHTPYRLINYDGPNALEAAERLAAINNYPVEVSIGYPTPGSFGSWAGIEQQHAVITLELPEKEAYTAQEHQLNLDGLLQFCRS